MVAVIGQARSNGLNGARTVDPLLVSRGRLCSPFTCFAEIMSRSPISVLHRAVRRSTDTRANRLAERTTFGRRMTSLVVLVACWALGALTPIFHGGIEDAGMIGYQRSSGEVAEN